MFTIIILIEKATARNNWHAKSDWPTTDRQFLRHIFKIYRHERASRHVKIGPGVLPRDRDTAYCLISQELTRRRSRLTTELKLESQFSWCTLVSSLWRFRVISKVTIFHRKCARRLGLLTHLYSNTVDKAAICIIYVKIRRNKTNDIIIC